MEIDMSFYSPIPEGKTIQGVFEEALQNGSIRNLTTNNTEATFTFVGKQHICSNSYSCEWYTTSMRFFSSEL